MQCVDGTLQKQISFLVQFYGSLIGGAIENHQLLLNIAKLHKWLTWSPNHVSSSNSLLARNENLLFVMCMLGHTCCEYDIDSCVAFSVCLGLRSRIRLDNWMRGDFFCNNCCICWSVATHADALNASIALRADSLVAEWLSCIIWMVVSRWSS